MSKPVAVVVVVLMRNFVFGLLCFVLGSVSALATTKLKIPKRAPDALSGRAFLQVTRHLDDSAREAAIQAEISKGNVPSFIRALKPVRLGKQATVWVTPDYLAIGSDRDFVRIPMSPITAQHLADRFDAMLPTPKLVDEINRQASLKLSPSPMTVRGAKMTSNEAYLRHHHSIQRQLSGRGYGQLISGHKKDVVLKKLLSYRPFQVAIYGWHRRNGKAIQPLSLVHHNMYADYSHGVRLVSLNAELGRRSIRLNQVLADKRLARLASYEGSMRTTRLNTISKLATKKSRPRKYSTKPRQVLLKRHRATAS